MPGYFKKKEDDAKAEAKANNKLPRINDPDGFYSTVDGKTVYADSTSNRLSEQVYKTV
jgi:predicted Zn-dependent protease